MLFIATKYFLSHGFVEIQCILVFIYTQDLILKKSSIRIENTTLAA